MTNRLPDKERGHDFPVWPFLIGGFILSYPIQAITGWGTTPSILVGIGLVVGILYLVVGIPADRTAKEHGGVREAQMAGALGLTPMQQKKVSYYSQRGMKFDRDGSIIEMRASTELDEYGRAKSVPVVVGHVDGLPKPRGKFFIGVGM